MLCPVCKSVNLVMSERQGVEIDYCPQCRGVWLDRGELDKIIDKSAGAAAVPVREQAVPTFRDERGHSQHHPKHDHYPHKRKREGFLSDIFDF